MSLQTAPLFLAEIVCYDASLGTTRTLRYASGNGYTTSPSATPANTFYDARILNAVDISRTMFSGGTTMGRSTVGLGDLVLNNADGGLDELTNYGFDGQSVTIRRSTVLNPSYPSDFTTVLVGTMLVPEFSTTEIRLKLRDRQQLVEVPFQTTKYAGDNSLPNGLEGTASDLKGKPKPVCYGVVKNIPAPCVNTSKLIYQVSDGTINSVDAVYDRGRALYAGFSLTSVQSIPGGRAPNLPRFGNGIFMAGTDRAADPTKASLVYTSPDGTTWTLKTSPFAVNVTLMDLAYGNGMWMAVSRAGSVATSTDDGATWTAGTAVPLGAGRGINTLSLAFGNGLFVVGDADIGTAAVPSIFTSPDGVTWTTRTTPFVVNASIAAVGYGSTTVGFVMVTNDVAARIATSVDGATWTLQTATTPAQPYSIGYGNGVYYIGLSGGSVLTSRDGTAWATRDTGMTIVVYGVAWGDGVTVASGLQGDNGVGVAVSLDDGVTWRNAYNGSSFGVAFGAHCFVVNGSASLSVTVPAAQTYASQADLLDDTKAPAPGTFKYYSSSSGSYFRLGLPPDGVVTADVTQGANAAARTAAQQFKLALARAGLTSSTTDYNATDITNLDSANSAVLGYWSGVEETTIADVIDQIAQTVGAWWAVDASGVFRIKQFTAPSGTAALTLTQNDLLPPGLNRVASNDVGSGVPVYKVTHRWGKYYQTLTTDLAAGVDDASRAQFAQEWRDVTASDSSVLTIHPLSQPLVIETLFSSATDASTEASRVLTLRSVQRDRYEITVPLNSETNALDLGDVIAVAHPRFALSTVGDDTNARAGLFRIIDIAPNAAAQEIRFGIWGRSTSRNRATVTSDGGRYRVTTTGAYRVTVES